MPNYKIDISNSSKRAYSLRCPQIQLRQQQGQQQWENLRTFDKNNNKTLLAKDITHCLPTAFRLSMELQWLSVDISPFYPHPHNQLMPRPVSSWVVGMFITALPKAVVFLKNTHSHTHSNVLYAKCITNIPQRITLSFCLGQASPFGWRLREFHYNKFQQLCLNSSRADYRVRRLLVQDLLCMHVCVCVWVQCGMVDKVECARFNASYVPWHISKLNNF